MRVIYPLAKSKEVTTTKVLWCIDHVQDTIAKHKLVTLLVISIFIFGVAWAEMAIEKSLMPCSIGKGFGIP